MIAQKMWENIDVEAWKMVIRSNSRLKIAHTKEMHTGAYLRPAITLAMIDIF